LSMHPILNLLMIIDYSFAESVGKSTRFYKYKI